MIYKIVVHQTGCGIRLCNPASREEYILVVVGIRRASGPIRLGDRVACSVAPVKHVHKHASRATTATSMGFHYSQSVSIVRITIGAGAIRHAAYRDDTVLRIVGVIVGRTPRHVSIRVVAESRASELVVI